MRRFVVHDVDQRSVRWFQLRAGLLTASVASDMLARIKTGEAAARRDLRARLVCERLTGQPQEDTFINRDMQRGIDLEAEALAEYELQTDTLVQRVGFLTHTEIAAGYSPDGVIGDFEGLLELKAPRPANHLEYLRGGSVPARHVGQLTHALWLTDAPWIDFASYCAQFPEPLRLFRIRVERNAVDLHAYELMVRTFLAEVERDVAEVTAQLGKAGAAA